MQHLKDLVYKITWHYSGFTPSYLSISDILKLSGMTVLSIFLVGGFLFIKPKIFISISQSLINCLGIITVIGIGIITTSDYQSPRYLTPIIFMWELLLPLFIFTLAKQTKHYKIISIFFIIFIAVSQTYLSIIDSKDPHLDPRP